MLDEDAMVQVDMLLDKGSLEVPAEYDYPGGELKVTGPEEVTVFGFPGSFIRRELKRRGIKIKEEPAYLAIHYRVNDGDLGWTGTVIVDGRGGAEKAWDLFGSGYLEDRRSNVWPEWIRTPAPYLEVGDVQGDDMMVYVDVVDQDVVREIIAEIMAENPELDEDEAEQEAWDMYEGLSVAVQVDDIKAFRTGEEADDYLENEHRASRHLYVKAPAVVENPLKKKLMR